MACNRMGWENITGVKNIVSLECHLPFSVLTGVTPLMDIDLPGKFSPLYISRQRRCHFEPAKADDVIF